MPEAARPAQQPAPQAPLPPARQVSQQIISLWVPQAIHAAAELGIADTLAAEPATAADVAARLGTHADATARLMNALVTLGLLALEDGRFGLTGLGRCLVTDSPTSVRAWSRLMGGAEVWRAWGRLADCVRSGRAAWSATGGERVSDTEPFDAWSSDPEGAAVFHQAMVEMTRGAAPGIVAAIDFAGARRIVDVGGGYGALLCAALETHPEIDGAVFDLAHARDGALALFAARGLEARASFVAGDFFRDRPPSADIHLMKSVIHDWDDARSLQILRQCREAMREGDRLLLVEPPAPPPGEQHGSPLAWVIAFSDLNMLVNTGGRERTAAEYRALLETAGLRVAAMHAPPGSFFHVFEAVRT